MLCSFCITDLCRFTTLNKLVYFRGPYLFWAVEHLCMKKKSWTTDKNSFRSSLFFDINKKKKKKVLLLPVYIIVS